jgi:peroxiredoxin
MSTVEKSPKPLLKESVIFPLSQRGIKGDFRASSVSSLRSPRLCGEIFCSASPLREVVEMKLEESTPDLILTHKAFCTLLLCAAIIWGFAGCGEDSVEQTGLTGTVLPLKTSATVEAVQDDAVVAIAGLDPEGNYEFLNLAEGEYEVVVKADGYMPYSQSVQVVEGQITEVEEITLEQEQAISGTVIVAGKVTQAWTNQPIRDAFVLVEYKDDTESFAYTRKDGSFAMSIQSDLMHTMTISKTGYESWKTYVLDSETVEINLAKIGLEVGNAAPNFTLPRLDGGKMRLRDTRGNVVAMGFCTLSFDPCITTAQLAQELHEKYESRGLVVLSINTQKTDDIEAIKKLRDEHGLTYEILLDPNRIVASIYRNMLMPNVIVLDRRGIIVLKGEGYNPGDEEILEGHILSLLGSPL